MIWALKWVDNKNPRHIIYEHEGLIPKLFRTRKEARVYANKRFGYIKNREDLRQEPFHWRIPNPVKIEILEKS